MALIEFTVSGRPVPQGSSRAYAVPGGARLVSTTKQLLDWRGDIRTEAQKAMRGTPLLLGPVRVVLAFRPAHRPAKHFLPANRRRPLPELRADAPEWHASVPDADKLTRAALDALSGVVFLDDRQVVQLSVTKRWPSPGEPTGVDVTVTTKELTR